MGSPSSLDDFMENPGKSYKKRKMITGVPPWIGNLHQPRNIASFFETYQVNGNSGPIHHIKPYFWGIFPEI
jgi:hypothetical protein